MTALLYFRSRRLATALVLLTVVIGVGALSAGSVVQVGQGTAHSVPAALLLLPAAAGAVVGAATYSPLEVWDRLGTGRVPAARLAGVVLLTAFAVGGALLVLPADILDGRGDLAAARNVAALCGLGLLAATALGTAVAWLPPLLLAGLALGLGTEPAVSGLWTWLLAPDADLPAGTVAALLWASGAAAFAAAGSGAGPGGRARR